MKHLELPTDLYTGIKDIDDQHRELFSRGNAVLFPISKLEVKDVLDSLAFLVKYVDKHFSDEELLMRSYDYERLEGHQTQHNRLRKDVGELYHRAKSTESVKGLASPLYYLFSDWFIYHIKEWDIDYAHFLQKHSRLDLISIGKGDYPATHGHVRP
jgi:hemerythrin